MEELITRFAEHGYIAVFVLMLLESACIPIPSEVTMLFGGYLATADAPGAQLSLVAVALAGTVGNLVGSWLAYWVGYKTGRAPLERWGKYVLIRTHDIDKAEVWFAKHGEAAVFFSRMLPVVRTFISLPAGMAKMPFTRFTVYTFLGCLPWVFALTIAGYYLGEKWHSIVGSFTIASVVIAAVLGGVAVVWYVRRRRTRAAAEAAPRDHAEP